MSDKINQLDNYTKTNVKNKDSFFRFLFGTDKARALELYNAVNGSDYKDSSELTINTLHDVIYMKMKNDVSILFGKQLVLYEHQSTVNPNMPLRGLMYASELYSKIFGSDPHIYSTALMRIPRPRYFVLYNGESKGWSDEVVKIRLSDMFSEPVPEDETGDFEWTATVININPGKNTEIKNRSVTLSGYCYFIERIRELKKSYSEDEAVDLAVQQCIDEGVLADILREQRSEVKRMLLTEFDEVAYREMLLEEGREEGREEGMKEGLEQGKLLEIVESILAGDYTMERGAEKAGMSAPELREYARKQLQKEI